MIDRFLNWGDHGKPKSGKIKGRCQPPRPPHRDNSTNNSSSNINKISVFGKGKYCLFFTDPKDRQVKHYYPNKRAVTL